MKFSRVQDGEEARESRIYLREGKQEVSIVKAHRDCVFYKRFPAITFAQRNKINKKKKKKKMARGGSNLMEERFEEKKEKQYLFSIHKNNLPVSNADIPRKEHDHRT